MFLAVGKRMQSYIRHLSWTLCGPCRHGICARCANRYKRQAWSCRQSYRRQSVWVRPNEP
jgi:hypothetical protein